jgi:hypothetical protein
MSRYGIIGRMTGPQSAEQVQSLPLNLREKRRNRDELAMNVFLNVQDTTSKVRIILISKHNWKVKGIWSSCSKEYEREKEVD